MLCSYKFQHELTYSNAQLASDSVWTLKCNYHVSITSYIHIPTCVYVAQISQMYTRSETIKI